MANNGELVWVWCPICHKGEGCVLENGKYTCPSTGKKFTDKESNDDIKNRK